MDLSLLELILSGGLLSLITGLVTIGSTRRKANAEASNNEIMNEHNKDKMVYNFVEEMKKGYASLIESNSLLNKNTLDDFRNKTSKLEDRVNSLEQTVSAQSNTITELNRKVNKRDFIIRQALGCTLIGGSNECIVLKTYNEIDRAKTEKMQRKKDLNIDFNIDSEINEI